jgi:hypothetical protein
MQLLACAVFGGRNRNRDLGLRGEGATTCLGGWAVGGGGACVWGGGPSGAEASRLPPTTGCGTTHIAHTGPLFAPATRQSQAGLVALEVDVALPLNTTEPAKNPLARFPGTPEVDVDASAFLEHIANAKLIAPGG